MLEEINKKIEDAIKREGYSVRGMRIVGKVVSIRMRRTATIEREIVKYFKKYKRWSVVKSKVHVHIPEGIHVDVGDVIEAGQTRKISKTKSWIITKIVKKGGEKK